MSAFDQEGRLRRLARMFHVLHSPLRLRVLAALAAQPTNVRELELTLRVSQPLLSWHLTQLRQAGLVTRRRLGREIWYSVQRTAIRGVVDDLLDLVGPGAGPGEDDTQDKGEGSGKTES